MKRIYVFFLLIGTLSTNYKTYKGCRQRYDRKVAPFMGNQVQSALDPSQPNA